MKRARDERQSVPVLHFKTKGQEEDCIRALGAHSIATTKLENFEIEEDELKNHYLYSYQLNDTRFCTVIATHITPSMCSSARQYNEIFATALPETKVVASIDPDGTSVTRRVESHHRYCSYITDVDTLLSYLEISQEEVGNLENLKLAIVPRIPEPVNPIAGMFNTVVDTVVDQEIRFFNPIDLVNFISFSSARPPAVGPAPPPKKVTIDKGWKEQLKPKDELKVAKHEDYACKACLEYEKTIVMLPCRHAFYCDACYETMMEDPVLPKECPICKEKPENIARIY